MNRGLTAVSPPFLCQSGYLARLLPAVPPPISPFLPTPKVRLHSRARPCYTVPDEAPASAGKERRMKPLATTFLATLLAGPAVLAQGPAPDKTPPPPATPTAMSDKNKQYLDAYLDAWEKRMQKIEGLETKVVLTEASGQDKAVRTGEAAILKPNYARIILKDQANPANVKKWRHFVADGKMLWEYDYGAK